MVSGDNISRNDRWLIEMAGLGLLDFRSISANNTWRREYSQGMLASALETATMRDDRRGVFAILHALECSDDQKEALLESALAMNKQNAAQGIIDFWGCFGSDAGDHDERIARCGACPAPCRSVSV